MAISTSISRLAAYYKRHGLRETIRRATVATGRILFAGRMVVFYCDLGERVTAPAELPSSLKLERLKTRAELDPKDLEELTSFWNPQLAHRRIEERFEHEASLWLIRSGDSLAGYGWTLRGRTIAPYYFPMGQDDVQLFDFYVFPKFRGRAVLWFLVTHILRSMKDEGAARVYGDVAEWNQASLSFYRTTPFRRLGSARFFTIFSHSFVSWSGNEPVERERKIKKRSFTATGPRKVEQAGSSLKSS